MKFRNRTLGLFLLFAVTLASVLLLQNNVTRANASKTLATYRDFSQKENRFQALNNLLIKADSVEFDRVQNANLLGANLQFRTYRILATVKVQTACIGVSRAVYGTAVAKYSLSVASDSNDKARRTFLHQINSYWKAKTAGELEDYKYLPAAKYLWSKKGNYVLYSQPLDEWPGATYLFYARGKIVRVTFEGFQSGNGWGGLSTFISNNLMFKFANTQINPSSVIFLPPKQFLKQYQQGFYKKRP